MIELSLLYYILKNQDDMTLLKLDESKFLDSKVKSYLIKLKNYKEQYEILPSISDFEVFVNNPTLFQDVKEIGNSLLPFYIDQVSERFNKYKFFNSLYDIINKNQETDFVETVSNVQDLLLSTQEESGNVEEIDCSANFEQEDFITRLPLGFGIFDEVNGGLAQSELCLLGGYRGQGKSLLVLHSALSRYKQGKTVGFISIEMRAPEVRFRLDSMVTGLPAKAIQFDTLTNEQLRTYFINKANFFCKPNRDFINFIKDTEPSKQLYEKAYSKLERKDHKFFLYDLPLCNLSDINYTAAKLKKLHKLNFLVVDYLNIIKVPGCDDPIGWKTQIQRSEGLKTIARNNDISLISPIQIDIDGKVKFATAIEDAVDLSILFQNKKGNGNNDALSLYVSKIRNGTELKFSLMLNKENLRISALKDKEEDE